MKPQLPKCIKCKKTKGVKLYLVDFMQHRRLFAYQGKMKTYFCDHCAKLLMPGEKPVE